MQRAPKTENVLGCVKIQGTYQVFKLGIKTYEVYKAKPGSIAHCKQDTHAEALVAGLNFLLIQLMGEECYIS